MRRADWTPLVVAATTVGLATIVLIWLMGNRFHDEDVPGVERPRRRAPPEVTLWVGEVGPGLKGALTDVYGDPGPDLEHDRQLNEQLGLSDGHQLAFYRLLLFNVTGEPHSFPVREGGLVVKAEGDRPAALKNLSKAYEDGQLTLEGGLAATLGGLGTLRDHVDVPPGSMANLVLAFDARRDLASARTVETAEGTTLRRLPMSRTEFRQLVADPRMERIKDL